MDGEEQFWIWFWAIVGVVSAIIISIEIDSYDEHAERMNMIDHGIAPPSSMSRMEYQLERERIEKCCSPS